MSMSIGQFAALCAADKGARKDDPERLFDGDLCVIEDGKARRLTFADIGAKTIEEAFSAALPDSVMIWWGGRAVPYDHVFDIGSKD